jgi:rod shape-determining protein MreD
VTGSIFLALVLDSMTSYYPTHLFGLVAVAWLTTQPQKRIKYEVISSNSIIFVMLRVFILVLLVEGLLAIQYFSLNLSFFSELWLNYQKISLSSALLTSLWTPLLYYPLNKWWKTK